MQKMSVDTIIMSEVAKSLSGEMPLKMLFTSLFTKVPRIFMFLVVKYSLTKPGKVLSPVRQVLQNIFRMSVYSKKLYNTTDVSTEEFHICAVIRNEKETLVSKSPIMYYTEANEVLTLHYIPLFHRSELTRLEELGRKVLEKYLTKINGKVIYKTLRTKDDGGLLLHYKTCTFSKLYPSANYLRLAKMIKRHFDISAITGNSNVLGVLVDGPPGLGKTKFTDFAVEHAIAGEVYKTDLTSVLNYPIEQVFSSLYTEVEITKKTIFVIDELDKYLNFQLRAMHRKIPRLVRPKFAAFCAEEKQKHLYTILRVLERDVPHPVVVIFFANNFGSIFEDVDMTHHKSLLSRFMKVEFEKCNREELANYITYYNDKFRDTEYYEEISHKEIRAQLRRDVSVTYRQLYHISIEANYEPQEMVRLLNAFQEEPEPVSSVEAEDESTEEEPLNTEKLFEDEKQTKELKPVEKKEAVQAPKEEQMPKLDTPAVPLFPKPESVKLSKSEAWETDYVWPAREYYKDKQDVYVKDKTEACATVKKFLDEAEVTKGASNKKVICLKLFKYLQSTKAAQLIMEDHPNFYRIIKDKVVGFSKEHPDLFLTCDSATVKFLCVVSGLAADEL